MANIGYARVSTADQHMALQLDALRKAGVDRVFRDQGVSGSKSARPGTRCLPRSPPRGRRSYGLEAG
ncbi:recombinase family protein [Mycolicibacterium fortuitum]|uniref:recombinase family protein n=1 Tax=Mycolicibacterium fortuitum TaxID=1766 RepID=UPI0027DFC8DC|nr:recombinase family protein [Mycolicibacterium fortuitum]